MPDVFTKENVPSYKRADMASIDPREMQPDPDLNGRLELPDIAKFERDFRDPSVGQLEPIIIKKVDGKPVIVDGVCRWRAALNITLAGEGPHGDGVFKLQCRYFYAKTPLEYFIATVKANIRNEPKPQDDAHNVALLVHNFGMPREDVALRVYGRTTADGKPDVEWVDQCLAINDLTPEGIDALKNGTLKVKSAVALSKLTATAQRSALKTASANGQKLTVAAIKRAGTSSGSQSTGEESPNAPSRRKVAKTWPVENFKALVQEYIDAGIPPHLKNKPCEDAVRDILGELLDRLDEPPTELVKDAKA